MKKTLLTLIISAIALSTGFAQFAENMISQPTHVIGRRINDAGEITKEINSDFSYDEHGKLTNYDCPELSLTTSFAYANDFLMQESTFHQGGEHPFYETTNYTYENGQIGTVSHLMSQMGVNQYWVYSYYNDGKLKRIDQKDEFDDDYHMHWLYDYENDGKTVIESYWTSWISQGMLLRKKTTRLLNDNFQPLSAITENFNESGQPTSTYQTNFEYTPFNMLKSETTQVLVEDGWINYSIIQYEFDEELRLSERLDGVWNQETNDWSFTDKITFEYSEDGLKYVVSFFKKDGDAWIWDVFNNETILFGSNFKNQQRTLSYMAYEPLHEPSNINQFEFTLTQTEEPTYVGIEDKENEICIPHPNPTNGLVTITGKDLKQVEVLNILGQCVAKVQGQGETLQIDIANLPAGVYFVNIMDEEGRKCVRKVVKE